MVRRRLPMTPLAVTTTTVLVAVSLPLVFVAVQALDAGWAPARALLHRPIAGVLITHTLLLACTVTVAATVVGFAAAYLVERTNLPLRRTFSVALVLPLAVPEFVQGFSWVTLTSSVRGYWGALLVMTCSLYPVVFLPVAAALRRLDPALEEVSRSCGRGRWTTLWRVTVPAVRPALGGGALLVCLYLLGEYGAFAALRYQTFATAIYTEYRVAYDTRAASVLTLLLCVVALLVVAGEARVSGARTPTARRSGDGRVAPLGALGWARYPSAALLAILLALSLGVPAAALVRWFALGNSSTLPPASIIDQTWTTLTYSLSAAVVATVLAVPPALYSWRRRTRVALAAERGAYLTRAVPGIAVGLSVIFFTIRYARPYYAQPPMLVAGYVALFFPLALTGIRSALARVPHSVEEVGRSLGVRPARVLLRVTLPLIAPGVGIAIALVTLSALTELTATLLLRPVGTETLTTQFWTYTTGLAYGAAAPYAAVMIGISIVPVLLLARRGAVR